MITENYHTAKGKKYFLELSNQLLDKKQPATYNQAIMDFGATICKPQNPLCNDCPFIDICKAFEFNKINDFPIKKEKIIHKKRHFHFFVIEDKRYIYITLRTEKDIWQTLHTFYLVESDSEIISFKEYNFRSSSVMKPQILNQTLSHQKITGYFYLFSSDLFSTTFLQKLQKINKNSISEYAFPRIIISFFEKNKYL
jgi:A/G-specific adenine glycosylase